MSKQFNRQIQPFEKLSIPWNHKERILQNIQNETRRQNQKRRLKTYKHLVITVVYEGQIGKGKQNHPDHSVSHKARYRRSRKTRTP